MSNTKQGTPIVTFLCFTLFSYIIVFKTGSVLFNLKFRVIFLVPYLGGKEM